MGDFTELHNEKKINLEVTCKLSCFVYSCKCLPNFVNMAALILDWDWGLLSAPGDREKRPCFTAKFCPRFFCYQARKMLNSC